MISSFLSKIEAVRPFSEPEAWALFRLAALGEAFGWAVLITGILIRHYDLPGRNIAVPIAGQVHGTLFLIYFGLLIPIYASLRWSRTLFFTATVVGVIPFGTLVLEQWLAHGRHRARRQSLLNIYLFRATIDA